MSCELECDDLGGRSWEELFRSMLVKTEDGCFALRTTAEAGEGVGSYTFPSNHGNTAYVSSDGSDLSGEVGNISKPFLTLQAAVDALDVNDPYGQVIILSTDSNLLTNQLTAYNISNNPYSLVIHDLTNYGIFINGDSDYYFGVLKIITNGFVFINSTANSISCEDFIDIQCRRFIIPATNEANFTHIGLIQCDTFTINANTNNPTLAFDRVLWKQSCNVDEPITYNRINPRLLKIVASQTGTSDPTFTTRLNETGETFTFVRVSNGEYELRSSGAIFDTNKMELFFGGNNMNTGSAGDASFGYAIVSSTVLQIKSYFHDSFENDDIMSGLPITIEFYP